MPSVVSCVSRPPLSRTQRLSARMKAVNLPSGDATPGVAPPPPRPPRPPPPPPPPRPPRPPRPPAVADISPSGLVSSAHALPCRSHFQRLEATVKLTAVKSAENEIVWNGR